MAAPAPGDVARFLGQGEDTTVLDLAGEHLAVVTELAKAYTRGGGFLPNSVAPNDDVRAVIITATARMMSNPEQADQRIGEVSIRGGFQGWSLAEQAVLNRYRVRAR